MQITTCSLGPCGLLQLMVGSDLRLVNVSYLCGAEDRMDGGFCHVVGFSSKLYLCCALNLISSCGTKCGSLS